MTQEESRHRAEVRTLIRRHFPSDADGLIKFFSDVEKRRGKESAEKLREDCRKAWAEEREKERS